MGNMFIKMKVMPNSPDEDLEALKEKTKKILEENEMTNITFAEEPIAFGLKAVIISFSMDESKELEASEQALAKVDGVSSIQVIDMRRDFV